MLKNKPRRKPRKLTVRIICGGHQCKVTPSVMIVKPGQTVRFEKVAGETVHIQVSEIGRQFDIEKLETRGHLTVPKKTPMGIYPYAVFCYEEKSFCTGSSMPIIIVPRCI
jgi:plastocyanin